MHTARYGGRGVELPCSLQACHPPSTLMCSATWKVSKPYYLGFLWQFHYVGMCWLNHWPLVTEFNPQPLFPPWRIGGHGMGGGTKNSNPLSSKSHFISINSDMVEKGTLWITEDVPLIPITRNSKSFRSSVPATGGKDQIYISYYITISQLAVQLNEK